LPIIPYEVIDLIRYFRNVFRKAVHAVDIVVQTLIVILVVRDQWIFILEIEELLSIEPTDAHQVIGFLRVPVKVTIYTLFDVIYKQLLANVNTRSFFGELMASDRSFGYH
jgi:hypothetical protein